MMSIAPAARRGIDDAVFKENYDRVPFSASRSARLFDRFCTCKNRFFGRWK
jgi:hypothetical protein